MRLTLTEEPIHRITWQHEDGRTAVLEDGKWTSDSASLSEMLNRAAASIRKTEDVWGYPPDRGLARLTVELLGGALIELETQRPIPGRH